MSDIGNLARWHHFMETNDKGALADMLHDDVVFTSPVVHTPQRGKAITLLYLGAAGNVLGGDTFRYVREFDCGDRAVLEFVCEIDGIEINGIDMIAWDEAGKIIDFKVMVRPLKAINKVHAKMGEMMDAMKAAKRAEA